MRHPEGGYVLQELAGVERATDYYGREYLVLHFNDDDEPVAVMLNNFRAPGGAYVAAEGWLLGALEAGVDGVWGNVPKEEVAA